MITNKELEIMEWASTKDDEYNNMCWGSRDDIQRLIKEVKRLNNKLDALAVEDVQ